MTRTIALTIALIAGSFSLAPVAQAQSFNCRHANTAIEAAICADGNLRIADREMARLYAIKLANDDETGRYRVTVRALASSTLPPVKVGRGPSAEPRESPPCAKFGFREVSSLLGPAAVRLVWAQCPLDARGAAMGGRFRFGGCPSGRRGAGRCRGRP